MTSIMCKVHNRVSHMTNFVQGCLAPNVHTLL
jgi:hypothetical protein